MSGSPPVAIAVVSFNTRDLLRANLASLQADAEAGRAEVWVVDNGSDDGSPKMVAEAFPWATLLAPGENLGFGRAVNRVAQRTRTPWVAAANADLRFTPGALAALLAAGDEDPGAGVLGPRLLLGDGAIQPSVQPFPTVANAALLALRAQRLRPSLGRRLCLPGFWDPEAGTRVDWVTGALMLIRRTTWDAIGGFDEDQWMYAEDIDVCWRAARCGWATRYVPAAVVHHEHAASTTQAFGAGTDRRWILATYAWLARRRGLATAWGVAATNAAHAGAAWLAFALLARRDAPLWAGRRDAARAHLRIHASALRGGRALRRAR